MPQKTKQTKSDVLKKLVTLMECQQQSFTATLELLQEMRLKQQELDEQYPEPAKMKMVR